MTAPDTAAFRKAMAQFVTGVTVVTVARGSGQVHGMTANAFASVSLDPQLVLVCVDHNARTHPILREQKRFGINVLREDQHELAVYFAQVEQDHESGERLGVKMRMTEKGTPLLVGSLARLECRLVAAHEAGDHTIFVGEVERAEIEDGWPLVFHGGKYQRLARNS